MSETLNTDNCMNYLCIYGRCSNCDQYWLAFFTISFINTEVHSSANGAEWVHAMGCSVNKVLLVLMFHSYGKTWIPFTPSLNSFFFCHEGTTMLLVFSKKERKNTLSIHRLVKELRLWCIPFVTPLQHREPHPNNKKINTMFSRNGQSVCL